MEERKKLGPFGVILLILLVLMLAITCFLSAGLPDLSMGMGPIGLYTTDGDSLYLAAAYLKTDTRDLLITDRRQSPDDGGLVTYLLDGRRTVDLYDDLLGRPILAGEGSASDVEAVRYILHEGGTVLGFLHWLRYIVWGITALVLVFLILLKLTANARWKKRQQKLMLKNFQKFGEKYAQEDEELDY